LYSNKQKRAFIYCHCNQNTVPLSTVLLLIINDGPRRSDGSGPGRMMHALYTVKRLPYRSLRMACYGAVY